MTSSLSLSQQARLLHWAVAQGLLSQEEVGLPLDPSTPTLSGDELSGQFEAVFVHGRLRDDLTRALAADDADRTILPDRASSSDPLRLLGAGADLAPADLNAFILPRDGRYVPMAFLGEGGMGRVYKVFDKQLKRVTAVKFLKHLDQGPLERFVQEARSQAQIDHPNVCNIFSVDDYDGQPYLSMRFIDGPTLKEAMGSLRLDEKVRIIQQMALALQACHNLGIVHRDLKPGNIMLERREDGAWWPYLLDFGLARELGDASLTVQGMILGTPTYCSPEQVQGRMADVDPRSDVYALGASLYECLCGEPPFPVRGDLMELIQRISYEDPISLAVRIPGLPRELQVIVAKTLEKDPARRYSSAQALAADLGRFLEGDPILARETRWPTRLARSFGEHKAWAVSALCLTLLVICFGTATLVMAWRNRLQSQSSFQFGREAEHLEALLQRAYSQPLHDLRPERALVQQRLDRIQAGLAGLSRWSRPAAHLALGRGYLALDRLEEARRELELGSAFDGGAQDPDTALALGLTLTRLYQADLEGLNGKQLEDKKRELDKSLRQPALACLRRTQGAHQDGPVFVEGLLALVEDREEDAITKARDYQQSAPWASEGPVLEAEAQQALARRAFNAGQFPQAEAHLAQGGKALEQALAVACGAPAALIAEAKRRLLTFQIRLAQGRATAADRDWALDATGRCLQANPEDWRALNFQAAIQRHWGVHLLNQGGDPARSLDAAVLAAEAGLKVRPLDNPLWNILGSALRNRGDWEFSQGQDPTRTLVRAVLAQQQALARPQFKDWLLDSIGCCYLTLGRYQLDHGQDPTQTLRDAQSYLDQAAALQPWVGHVTAKGNALHCLATYLTLSGQDPRPAMLEARQAFAAGLSLNAHSFLVHQGLANLLLDWAEDAQARSHPDLEALASAREHLHEVLDLNPELAGQVHPAMARAYALEALARQADSGARGQALKSAREALMAARGSLLKAGVIGKPEQAIAFAGACLVLQKADPQSRAADQGLAVLGPALLKRPWDHTAAYLQSRLLAALGQEAASGDIFRKACAGNANLRGAARI